MQRLTTIQKKIKNDQIDALFITSPYNIVYLTNLPALIQEDREYYLFVTPNNTYVLAPRMFMLAIKEKLPNVTYIEITKNKNPYKIIEEILVRENIKVVGFEETNLLFREYKHLTDRVKRIKLIPLENFIEDERVEKDSDEIENIKSACNLTDDAYSNVLKNIRMSVTEKQLAWEIESYIRKKGGQLSFPTIVAFGKNAAVPHHISSDEKLTLNSFVLFDMGAEVNGYTSDMSRTVFFGKPSTEQVKIFQTVKDAQQMSLEKLREWQDDEFEASHLHTIAESHIENVGYPPFPHGVGHGLGLQVHEIPSISKYTEGNPLRLNSVITIEPGIYLPEVGGVRIEDTVLLTNVGYEILTKSKKQLTIIK